MIDSSSRKGWKNERTDTKVTILVSARSSNTPLLMRMNSFRQSIWNFQCILLILRLLIVSALAILFFCLLLDQVSTPRQAATAAISTISKPVPMAEFFSFSPPAATMNPEKSKLANFTLKFANVERQYRMEGANSCDDAENNNGNSSNVAVQLLVLIMSRRDTEWKRRGIRESWARDAPPDIVIRYVIGDQLSREQNSSELNAALQEEQRKFGDLIRYYAIADGYDNLHFKMGAAFQWQQAFCRQAQFVMKTDDDTIVDLPRWRFWTERKFRWDLERNEATFFGRLYTKSKPIREKGHKWYVPVESFAGNLYPPYMEGATYFGSSQAVRAVMAHTEEVVGFNMDDILYTGTLAESANVSRLNYGDTHFRSFNPLLPKEPCEQGQPLVFALYRPFESAEQFSEAYKQLHGLKC